MFMIQTGLLTERMWTWRIFNYYGGNVWKCESENVWVSENKISKYFAKFVYQNSPSNHAWLIHVFPPKQTSPWALEIDKESFIVSIFTCLLSLMDYNYMISKNIIDYLK